MTPALVVARLAARELWITFRLLGLLSVYVVSGALVALVPAPPEIVLERLAIGLGAAAIVGAGVAAEALATERVLGRAGWLVTRSVSRGTLLVGWFMALASLSLVGLAAASLLGWLAISAPFPLVGLDAYIASIAGVAALALAGLAMGLVAGAILPPMPATLAAVGVAVALGIAGTITLPPDALPVTVLADLASVDRPMAVTLRGGGIALAAAAASIVVARVALRRVEL